MKIIVLIIIAFSIVSCGADHSEVSTVSQREAEEVSYQLKIKKLNGSIGWNENVTLKLYQDLSENSISSLFDQEIDQQNLDELGCSNFNSLPIYEKKLFYIVFLAAIAERESDFNPRDITNSNIGILQIDLSSAYRHAGADAANIKTISDLMNVNENLRIGTHILKNQVNGKWAPDIAGKLLTGRNYYWEVLNNNFKYRVIKSFMNNRFNLPFCQSNLD